MQKQTLLEVPVRDSARSSDAGDGGSTGKVPPAQRLPAAAAQPLLELAGLGEIPADAGVCCPGCGAAGARRRRRWPAG